MIFNLHWCEKLAENWLSFDNAGMQYSCSILGVLRNFVTPWPSRVKNSLVKRTQSLWLHKKIILLARPNKSCNIGNGHYECY